LLCVLHVAGDIPMLRAERFLEDGKSALVERLRIRVPALFGVEPREVVEAAGDIRMLRAERFLADGQSALVERLRIRVPALVGVEPREDAAAVRSLTI